MATQKGQWNKDILISLLTIALIIALIFYDDGSYLVVGAVAGVVVLAIWLGRCFKRATPDDKFHFFHAWKIPDPTTRGAIWLISAFDGVLYSLQSAAIFALVEMTSKLSLDVSGSLAATVAVVVMAAATPAGYWSYRRRYKAIAGANGGRLLRYVGESDLTFREKCGLAIAAIAGVIALSAAAPLWLARFA